MKSIFDNAAREEILNRIHSLKETSPAQWGKMNVVQMMKHCSQWDEMALGKKKYKQSFMGWLFGRMALKDMMKDKPVKKNLPTVPSFIIKDHAGFEEEKTKWISLLEEYPYSSNDHFIHPFFGSMTKENTGYMVYKHIDHHLRQFNC